MAAITFSVKLDTEKDAELVEWLQTCESKSYEIKAALYHYRNLPPPPPPSITTGMSPFDPSALNKAASTMNNAADKMARAADKLARSLETMQGGTIPIYENRYEEPEPEADPDLELAAANFINTFG